MEKTDFSTARLKNFAYAELNSAFKWDFMRKGHDQQLVDVICQHNKDGSMIPMRVRLTDEDGAVQTYTIKNYEDLSHQGTRTMPDGMYVTDRTFVYECQVQAFGRYRMIRLYYEPSGTVWKMTV
jgi:hypothetical protein